MAFFHAEENCLHLRQALKILVMADAIALYDNRGMRLEKPSQPIAPEKRDMLSTSSTSTAEIGERRNTLQ